MLILNRNIVTTHNYFYRNASNIIPNAPPPFVYRGYRYIRVAKTKEPKFFAPKRNVSHSWWLLSFGSLSRAVWFIVTIVCEELHHHETSDLRQVPDAAVMQTYGMKWLQTHELSITKGEFGDAQFFSEKGFKCHKVLQTPKTVGAVCMRDVIFLWVMTPYSLVDEYQYFGISRYAVCVEEESQAGRLGGEERVTDDRSGLSRFTDGVHTFVLGKGNFCRPHGRNNNKQLFRSGRKEHLRGSGNEGRGSD
jgi:hypothetical protein